jgi:serine/threonine protein kinase
MPLTPGTRLGPYEIATPVGAGGMGEVYRARDTRLERTVAIKVLPGHLSDSPEAKERFDREARSISSLNHPHICSLYDIGHQDGIDYLVMEFLEGETLAERLKKGPLSLKKTLAIGVDVCDALELAHGHGIVHRDLKPGNIMLTASGAKLMDFGLAKAMTVSSKATVGSSAAPSFTAAATAVSSSPLTTAGTVIGTVQYMSPEQIEGKEIDSRSDIFSLGSVLYEMASGKQAFEGKSQISLASAILEKDPEPISTIKPMIPAAFEHALATCLQKEADQRYQTAHDLKLHLQWITTSSSSMAMSAMPRRARKHEPLWWALGFLIALGLGLTIGALINRSGPPAPVMRTVINPPDGTTLNLTGDSAGPPVLSPDGSMLAFTASKSDGSTAIWVRPIDSLDAHILSGSENAVFPFWSPDSRSLGFFADGKLKTVDFNGSVQVVADAPFGRGGAWGADGVILFSANTQSPLMRVNAGGGTPVPVTKLDLTQHTSHRWPFFLPDGKHFLYLAINHNPSSWGKDMLFYASLDGSENRPLFHTQANAIYAGGLLLFARNDQLLAQRFDPASGKLSGDPSAIAKGILNDETTWHMGASAFGDRLLVLGSGGSGDWQLVWVDREGKQIANVADKLTNLQAAAISPQGDRIAMQIDTGQSDIWTLDLTRGVRTRLTFGPTLNAYPVWSPDGKWIAFTSDRNGHSELRRKSADGSGPEEVLLTDDQLITATDWSRDGKYVIYNRGPIGGADIWAIPLEGDRKPFLLVPHAANSAAVFGELSPDERWLTYTSTESGAPEVYVAAFRGQGKWQISANGGHNSRWSSDGKELCYLDPAFNLYTVPVTDAGDALRFGSPQKLVDRWSSPNVFYDVTRDGKKILLDRISQQVNQSVTVVTNYASELKK